jgi:tetratricopeptide (TPR) repeat protein
MKKYQFPKIDNEIYFEQFTRDILRLIYNDNSFELYGRKGQQQFGIDGQNSTCNVFFQCKHKSTSNIKDITLKNELEEELTKSKTKINELSQAQNSKYLFFTTHSNTTKLQDKARKLSTNKLTVEYWGWGTIDDYLNKLYMKKNIDFFNDYYPEAAKLLSANHIPNQLTLKSGTDFIIGREQELLKLDRELNNKKIVLINGIGGIGKSTLSAYYLNLKKNIYDYYGFFDGLEDFISELVTSFNITSQNDDYPSLKRKVFKELRMLKGSKLFIIDNLKNTEEEKKFIEDISTLIEYDYRIIINSREEIGDIEKFYLNNLSPNDAKNLFNSIYQTENEEKIFLEEILEYLDYHTFFVEKTAHLIKNKQGRLTLENIKEKFTNGELPKLTVKRKENFEDYLNSLFTLESLEAEEVLALKQFSILPSIAISLDDVEEFFNKKEDTDFCDLLEYLFEKGWLIKFYGGYKLHQIIKEYLLSQHTPSLHELHEVIRSFNIWIFLNEKNTEVFAYTQTYFSYFESFFQSFNIINKWNEDLLVLFFRIGTIYLRMGKISHAIKYLDKTLEISKNINIQEDILNAIYNNLSEAYRQADKFQKAHEYMNKSISLTKNMPETDDILILANQAMLCLTSGDYTEATKLYNKALEISNEENLSKALVYKGLAELYKLQGKPQESIDFFSKTLEIRKRFLDSHNRYIAQSYNDLGFAYSGAGELDKALSCHTKALELYKVSLGTNHPDIAVSYQNLAETYRQMEDYKKFLPLIHKAMKISKQELGEKHTQTALVYNTFATYYFDIKQDKKALGYWEKALKIFETNLGKSHHHTIFTYLNIINFYYEKEDYDLAFKYMHPIAEISISSSNTKTITIPAYYLNIMADIIKKIKRKNNFSASRKIQRNKPCPCKSGKKYKKCCGQ